MSSCLELSNPGGGHSAHIKGWHLGHCGIYGGATRMILSYLSGVRLNHFSCHWNPGWGVDPSYCYYKHGTNCIKGYWDNQHQQNKLWQHFLFQHPCGWETKFSRPRAYNLVVLLLQLAHRSSHIPWNSSNNHLSSRWDSHSFTWRNG